MRADGFALAALLGVIGGGLSGCELVVSGYAVEASAGGAHQGGEGMEGGGPGSGGAATCTGLPNIGAWDFEGADALDGLEPLGALGGTVHDGVLVFEYAGQTPGPGGRTFAFPPGTTRASVCAEARWDDVFDSQTLLLAALELTWTGGEYCGFFLALTTAGALQLFAIATIDGDQVAIADEQGSVVPAASWQHIELFVDPVGGQVTARIGASMVALDYAAEGFNQCPADPANVRLTVGSALSAPGTVVLELDDLRVGRSAN